MANKKLTAFISYAHQDSIYSEQFIEELKNHTPTNNYEYDLWSDNCINLGSSWDQEIQKKISECDFAILLVSASFFNSGYIEHKEFNKFLKRHQENGFLFIPVLLDYCDINKWESLNEKQFFIPSGEKYGKTEIEKLSYSDLIKFDINRKIIPNPNRQRYIVDFIKSFERAVKENQKKNLQPSKKTEKYFKLIKKAKELVPKDILGIRQIKTNFYWEREIDKELFKYLTNLQCVLVIGNSLAGKTRSVYEALKKMPDYTVIIAKDHFALDSDFSISESINGKLVAIFDDINEIMSNNKDELNKLLTLFLSENILIIATCRKGNELNAYESLILPKIRENFKQLEIPKMTQDQVDSFKRLIHSKNIEIDEKAFDHNIGSYFMDLSVMSDRYRDLEKIIKKYELTVPENLPREILKSLKYFYFTENLEAKSSYHMDKIKDFCERSLLNKKACPKNKTNLSKWQKKLWKTMQDTQQESHFSNIQWNNALEVLRSTKFNLNFIELNYPHIKIEEAYVERVIETDMKSSTIINKLDYLYSKEELEAYGFLFNIFGFTKLIQQTSTLKEALKIFNKLKALGLEADAVIFNSLINKSSNFNEALNILDRMINHNIEPNVITFTSLINKASNFNEALNIHDRMINHNIEPNVITFTSLINKASSFNEAKTMLDTMIKLKIEPDEITFTTLINKASNYNEAKTMLDTMIKLKIEPDEITFATLINKASNYNEAKTMLGTMIKLKIEPNEITFNSLINKAPNFYEAQNLFNKMIFLNLEPNVRTFTTLINKVSSFNEAKTIFNKMNKQNIEPNVITFNSLIKKAPNFNEAKAIFNRMIKQNIEPNERTFNSLINKVPNINEARTLLDKIILLNLDLNERTFNSLINKIPNINEANTFLDKMILLNLEPSVRTFTILINKVSRFNEAKTIFNMMIKQNIEPNEFTFNSLLNKASNFDEAKTILDKMIEQNLKPNLITINSLINKASNFDKAKTVLDIMIKHNIEPNEITFKTFLKKVRPNPVYALSYIIKMQHPTNLFKNKFLNRIITKCCKINSECLNLIQPYYSIISQQQDDIIIQYSAMLEVTNNPIQALDLLKNIKEQNSNFYNIKANCMKSIDKQESLRLYTKAYELASTNKEKSISLKNAAQLIFDNNMEGLYELAIKHCNKALRYTAYENFTYAGKLLFLLTYRCSSPKNIVQRVKSIIKDHGIGCQTIVNMLSEIEDDTKKNILLMILKK